VTPDDVLTIDGPRPLRGTCRLPGEKGMSHRALLFAALGTGTTTLHDLAPGDDVGRTAEALRVLGVPITTVPSSSSGDAASTEITGRGIESLTAAGGEIDCGNSGTTIRMLAGLLAGRAFSSVLTGDSSLRSRPMARVVVPLRELGAHITGPDDGAHAPLEIAGGALTGARVVLPVASGQVKTAMVLAGLQADGTTEVVEPAPSRDHTERMLQALGAPVTRLDDRTLRVTKGAPSPFELELPGDPSSAAFLVVAATITPGSEIVLADVLLNPGRIAFVDALRSMSADIDVRPRDERLGEPVGDLVVRAAALQGAVVECHEPMIDEVPALAVAATFATGTTEFRGAAELRVKESDRIATVSELVAAMGGGTEARPDGFIVRGGRPHRVNADSHGDHRIALAAAVAANATPGPSTIAGWSATRVSYPGFERDLEQLAT
jgi:3-phosphoshikimate 1-carboxyvinyltransferase